MLNKGQIKLNISILKTEKDKLNRAIESCKKGILSDEKSTIAHINRLEKKIANIDKIISYFSSL